MSGPHCIWGGMNFRPVTPTGWKQLAVWMVPFVIALIAMVSLAAARPTVTPFFVIPFLIGTAIWTVAQIRWCKRQV